MAWHWQAASIWGVTKHVCMQALKQYKQDHPERWDHVANAVDGKSKAACRARYKELRESFRAKKP